MDEWHNQHKLTIIMNMTNITMEYAKQLIESGVDYTVFCSRHDVASLDDVIKLRESRCYEDLIFDYYEEEGYEEHDEDEWGWNSGKWIVTKPACIEILVSLNQSLTWEEMSQILVG
jgi:glutamyl/glutaminyl-tRNA synthetase